MKYVILFLMSQNVMADDWFCKSQTSKKEGNVVTVCGMGIGLYNEMGARSMALNNAKYRFQDICQMSKDCYSLREISAEVKRVECNTSKTKLTTCYQLIEFTLK